MFSYYGSKSKIIDSYPKPRYDKIIEPFAGSARYSLKWFDRDILIVDKYEVIVRIWKYLQQCTPKDIMSLPEPKLGEKINRADFDCIERAWLMGFLVQQGVQVPMLTVSPFVVDNIGVQKKNMASQLFKIKHWKIELGSYEEIENQEATWFIDPPYFDGGHKYKHSNKNIDFEKLGEWCRERNGQVIVCENTSAKWLPFKPMKDMRGQYQTTTEAIWSNERTNYDDEQQNLFCVPFDNSLKMTS
jgi:site-specific DNA-adenine methylase